MHCAVADFEIAFVDFEFLAGHFERFGTHIGRGRVDGVARDDCAARGKGARAPVEFGGVAGDETNVIDVGAKLLGDHLRKGGEMALPLGTDSGSDANTSARLDCDARAFVWSDASAFDIRYNAETDMLAFGAQTGLFFLQKVVVVDELDGFIERGFVVAAVVGEGRKILVDNFVIIGKFVGRNEVAAADFDAVDTQLFGRDVEHSFHDEDAMLTARAAVGCDDGFVGEDGFEFAVIVRHVVLTEQGALAVERQGEAVGCVGAGVVQKGVVDAEDAAIAGEGDFDVVDLAALLGGGVEIFLPIFDPFDGPIELL